MSRRVLAEQCASTCALASTAFAHRAALWHIKSTLWFKRARLGRTTLLLLQLCYKRGRE
jgi:hypothetical protein